MLQAYGLKHTVSLYKSSIVSKRGKEMNIQVVPNLQPQLGPESGSLSETFIKWDVM